MKYYSKKELKSATLQECKYFHSFSIVYFHSFGMRFHSKKFREKESK